MIKCSPDIRLSIYTDTSFRAWFYSKPRSLPEIQSKIDQFCNYNFRINGDSLELDEKTSQNATLSNEIDDELDDLLLNVFDLPCTNVKSMF